MFPGTAVYPYSIHYAFFSDKKGPRRGIEIVLTLYQRTTGIPHVPSCHLHALCINVYHRAHTCLMKVEVLFSICLVLHFTAVNAVDSTLLMSTSVLSEWSSQTDIFTI